MMPFYKGITKSGPKLKLSNGRLTKPVSPKTAVLQYTLPPIVFGLGVYLGSLWKSFVDTEEKNRSLIEYYVLESIESMAPDRFLDFNEPELVFNPAK